jgi:putative membrane protein
MNRQRWIYLLSGVICVVVGFLIMGPRPPGLAGAVDVSLLPTVNASLNGVAFCLLMAGFVAVKSGRKRVHRWLMTSAFCTSGAFLVSYVFYHWFQVGPAKYHGDFRLFYFFVLMTHIVLAVVILPLAMTTLSYAVGGQIAQHKRVAPITFGLWVYVSLTGVLIYWMVHA